MEVARSLPFFHSVARMNYSPLDHKVVESVIGFEYDAGCWLARVLLERTQTSSSTATGRVMFQLEFDGFTRVGLSPEKTLTSNISHYQNLRDASVSGGANRTYD